MTFKFLSLASTGTEPLKSADIRSHRAVRRRDAGRETPPPPFRAVINKSESRLTKSLQWSGEQFIGSLISGIRERRQQQRQQQQKYQICDVSLFFFVFFVVISLFFFFTSFTSDSAIAIRFEQLRRRRRRLWKLRKPKKKNDNKEKGEGKKWIEKNDNEKKNKIETTERQNVDQSAFPFIEMRRWLSLSLSLSLSIAAFLSGSFIHRFIMALRQTLFFFVFLGSLPQTKSGHGIGPRLSARVGRFCFLSALSRFSFVFVLFLLLFPPMADLPTTMSDRFRDRVRGDDDDRTVRPSPTNRNSKLGLVLWLSSPNRLSIKATRLTGWSSDRSAVVVAAVVVPWSFWFFFIRFSASDSSGFFGHWFIYETAADDGVSLLNRVALVAGLINVSRFYIGHGSKSRRRDSRRFLCPLFCWWRFCFVSFFFWSSQNQVRGVSHGLCCSFFFACVARFFFFSASEGETFFPAKRKKFKKKETKIHERRAH